MKLLKYFYLLLCVIGCKQEQIPVSPPPDPKLSLVIIDISQSMSNDKHREMVGFISRISDRFLNYGDKIIIIMAGSSPSIANKYQFTLKTPAPDLTGMGIQERQVALLEYENTLQMEQKTHLSDILELFKAVRNGASSELLASLALVNSSLRDEKEIKDIRLFIFSDGVENSDIRKLAKQTGLNLTQINNLAEQDVTKLKDRFGQIDFTPVSALEMQIPRDSTGINSRIIGIVDAYWKKVFKTLGVENVSISGEVDKLVQ